jgi:hypothetical protein
MSFGSRATQAKPEALVILFRANPETALFLRITASLRPSAEKFGFPQGNLFFFAFQTGLSTGA